MEYVTLNNGVRMPVLGYGVYQIAKQECTRCVLDAIDIGYRLIDTAQVYGNEEEVGTAALKSGVPREEIFLTSKVWITNQTYRQVWDSVDNSLEKMQTDYIDLLLLHQPFKDYYEVYEAMERVYKTGRAKAIGVSNFYPERFVELANHCKVVPAVNQVEMHVFQQQRGIQATMKTYGTQLESWAPFAEGKNNYFQNPVLKKIGEQHGKSVAQTALRFLLQSGAVVIPKSTGRERMEEDFNVFDFVLDEREMAEIRQLDEGKSLFASHLNDETGAWLRADPPKETD